MATVLIVQSTPEKTVKEVIVMKFSDFFLPKIARSDPKVRMTAIADEINVELLKQIVEKDEDPEVRDTAERRIRELQPEYETV